MVVTAMLSAVVNEDKSVALAAEHDLGVLPTVSLWCLTVKDMAFRC